MNLMAAALCASIALAVSHHTAHAAPLTVVEIFQSQGCSSCPPANAQFLKALERPDILGLSFQVTYWNYLGWTDTFSKSAFDARQYDYARALHHDGVFTPQVVVNGRVDGPGTDAASFASLVREGGQMSGPSINIVDSTVRIGAGSGSGEIILVRYDPNIVQVPILRGENGGRTLPHRNVVHDITRLGTWQGQALVLPIPPTPVAGLKSAILLQAADGGTILAAAQ